MDSVLAMIRPLLSEESIYKKSYQELYRQEKSTIKRFQAVRAKEAYLLLKLFNRCTHNSYKSS